MEKDLNRQELKERDLEEVFFIYGREREPRETGVRN